MNFFTYFAIAGSVGITKSSAPAVVCYILDEDGISGEKEDFLLELRASGKNICAPYADKFSGAKFFAGKKPWEVKADLYIPCATQNEIHMEDAKTMVANGCKFLCEGANMPTTNEALA